eukprot:GEMP01000725.1.p1 GENE.GEMP01000725.1~~GEMP01000725.1.p1  ORF type:complete len:1466 (+),score=172.51 GEMP01000725.1:29-4399(+)
MAHRLPNEDVESHIATNSQSDVMSGTTVRSQNSVHRSASRSTAELEDSRGFRTTCILSTILTSTDPSTQPLSTEGSDDSSDSNDVEEKRWVHCESPRGIIITAPVDSATIMPPRPCSPRVQIREVMSEDIFEFGPSQRSSAATKESIEVPLQEALQSLTLISRSKARVRPSGGSCSIEHKSSFCTDGSETLYELPDQTAFDNKSFMRVHRESSNLGNVHDQYFMEEILGEGAYGAVWAARERMHANMVGEKFGRRVAIKKVPALKRSSINSSLGADIFREIAVLKTVDHPSVARLFEVFEDEKNMYLVLEKCEGGELLDRIMHQTLFEEEEALKIMLQVTSALVYCHRRDIIHRDIKPENILFVTEGSDVVKLVDFGLALGSSDQTCQNRTGTEIYSAPELHQAVPKITKKADMWAVGCVLYSMLSGQVPFSGNNALQALKQGTFAPMVGGVWDDVSEECKDAIRGLLRPNPLERFSAEEMLHCSWFAGSAQERQDNVNENEDLKEHMTQLRAFEDKSLFRRVCLSVVARHMEWTQCERFYEMFCSMDIDGDGMISISDWQQVWDATVSDDMNGELEAVFAALNLSQSGSIEFTEYLAACVDLTVMDEESVLWSTFSYFGAKDGTLKFSALESSLKHALPHDSVDLVVSVDEVFSSMSDIRIRFQDFKLMLRDGIRGSDDVTSDFDDSEGEHGISPMGVLNGSFRCVTWNDEVEHREQRMSLLDIPNTFDCEAPTITQSELSRATILTILTASDDADLTTLSPRILGLSCRSPTVSYGHGDDVSPLSRIAQDSPTLKCVTPHSVGVSSFRSTLYRSSSALWNDHMPETRDSSVNAHSIRSPVSVSRISLDSPIHGRGEIVTTTTPLTMLPICARGTSGDSVATGSAKNNLGTPSLGLPISVRSRDTTAGGLGLPISGRSRDTIGGGMMLPIGARGGADTSRSSACLSVLPITSRSGGETGMSAAMSTQMCGIMTPNMSSSASGLSLGLPIGRRDVAAESGLNLGLPIGKNGEACRKSPSGRSDAPQRRDTQTGAKTCRSARSARSMVSVKKLRGRSIQCSPTRSRPTVLSSPYSPRTQDNRSRLPFSQCDTDSVVSNFSDVFFPNDTNKDASDDSKPAARDTFSPRQCDSVKDSYLSSPRVSSVNLALSSLSPHKLQSNNSSNTRQEYVVQLTRELMLPDINSVSPQGGYHKSGVSPSSTAISPNSTIMSPVLALSHSPNRLGVDPALSILKTHNGTHTEAAKHAREYRTSNSPPTFRKVQIISNRTSFHSIESPRRNSHRSSCSISNRPTEVSKGNSQSATSKYSRHSELSKNNSMSILSSVGTHQSETSKGNVYSAAPKAGCQSEESKSNVLSIASIGSRQSETPIGGALETNCHSEELDSPSGVAGANPSSETPYTSPSSKPSNLKLPIGELSSFYLEGANMRSSSGFELSPRRRYKLNAKISAVPFLGPPLE